MRSIHAFFVALLGLFVFCGFAQAQNAWPVLTSMTHVPETVGVGMTSELQLSFANAQVAGTADSTLAAGSIQLQICGSPNYYKTDGATPPGGYGANFTWTHPSKDCWVGVNNVPIAADSGGTITLNYTATQITLDPQETTASIGELTPACCSNASAPTGLSASFAVASPILSSGFSPTTIASGGVTTLTFTLFAADLAPATAISFADKLPSGLVVAPTPNIGGTCSNAAAATTAVAGGSTIAVSNVAVPSGPASCTIAINVTNAAGRTNASCAANPPAFTNGPGNIANLSAAAANGVEDSCVVVAASPTAKLTLIQMGAVSAAFAGTPSGVITYSFSVVNTGDVAFNSVPGVSDTLLPSLSCSLSNPPLAAGATQTLRCTNNVYTLTGADFKAGRVTSTATASAVPAVCVPATTPCPAVSSATATALSVLPSAAPPAPAPGLSLPAGLALLSLLAALGCMRLGRSRSFLGRSAGRIRGE